MKRIVVTGLGAVTSLGNDVDSFWQGMLAGASGAGPITRFDASSYPTKIACEVRDFEPTEWMDRKSARRLARCTQFAVATSKQAVRDAGLDATAAGDRLGVVFNTGGGGCSSMEDGTRVLDARGPQAVSPMLVTNVMSNAVSCLVSIELGATGPTITTTLACAAGNYALVEAFHLLQRGEADFVVAGGAEASVSPLIVASFSRMQALSTRNDDPTHASRPFDRDRDGLVAGEGAAAFLLETEESARERGATIYATVLGGALTADAHHVAAPRPDGSGAARAMSNALRASGLEPSDIDVIYAHATSTPLGDVAECHAVRSVFGDDSSVTVTATKSQLGHTFGAAGAVSALAAIKGLGEGRIPPTINLDDQDPECPLDIVANDARDAAQKSVLVNAFGFGGQNVALALERYE